MARDATRAYPSNMFTWVRFGESESAQQRCFCIDVTCDNLLDAVKQIVEEETTSLIKRRDADLVADLREYVADEQSLEAKVARFEALQQSTPPEASTALELARHHKASTESKLLHLRQSMMKFKGLAHCQIDLIEPSSGVLKNLASNPRKRATAFLQAGNTYEAARLDKTLSGPPTSTPLGFSLLTAATMHPAHQTP